MKNSILLVAIILLMFSCGENSDKKSVIVKNIDELENAVNKASPGTEIVMANGVWKDVQINFYGKGSEKAPITLCAETPGEVFIEGQSFLHLGGEYLTVSGLYFRNGYNPVEGGIIGYRIGKDSIAFNCRVTECVIEDFNQPNRGKKDRWIELYGKYNQLDHCYIAGKTNDGVTLMVYHKGNEHTNNYHQIVNNYFGPRPRKGGPRAETMRLGGSETSMTPGRANISNNYFEACNGEVEIISDKTNFNSFKNNIFYKCEGSLVLRHSNYTTVDGNIFIGDDDSDFYGGIRVVNTGHWITNNYFYKINGEEFRTPLAIMNGIPKSSLNRYKQVTDVVVAYNTWTDCRSPWQIGVGQNIASSDVLPKNEIRSAPPIRCIIADNLIYNTQADKTPVLNHDDIEGIKFINNILDNNGSEFTEFEALNNGQVKMKKINNWLYVPQEGQNELLNDVYFGYDFAKIEKDLFGSTRGDNNKIGAVSNSAAAEGFMIDKSKYGPTWFSPEIKADKPTVHTVSSTKGELVKVIAEAKSGDLIELIDTEYTLSSSLKIDKEITILSKDDSKVKIIFTGEENTPAFEMNPYGKIRLKNVTVKGYKNQLAFAPLSENMSSAYYLFVDNCEFDGFEYMLKASKGSFADSISFSNTKISNCENGFVLAADEKGDYNAEIVSFEKCNFSKVKSNVVHFYRGGYDESTIGGFLTLTGNTFTGCGVNEKSGTLIRTPGIINVFITGNNFRNNPVKLVAILWGEKNNHHNNNSVIQSGKIMVEEQQKLDILY